MGSSGSRSSSSQEVVYVLGTSSAGKTSAVRESVKKLDGFQGWEIDKWVKKPRRETDEIELQKCQCSPEFHYCAPDFMQKVGRYADNPDNADIALDFGSHYSLCLRKYFNRDINQSQQNAIVDDVDFREQDLKGNLTKIILYTKLENMVKNARKRTEEGNGRMAQSIFGFFFDIYKIDDSPSDALESFNFVQFRNIFESFPTVDEVIRRATKPGLKEMLMALRNHPTVTFDAKFAWKRLTKNNIACQEFTCYIKVQDKFKDFTLVNTSDENGKYMGAPEVADKIIAVYKGNKSANSSATDMLGLEMFCMIILLFVMSI